MYISPPGEGGVNSWHFSCGVGFKNPYPTWRTLIPTLIITISYPVPSWTQVGSPGLPVGVSKSPGLPHRSPNLLDKRENIEAHFSHSVWSLFFNFWENFWNRWSIFVIKIWSSEFYIQKDFFFGGGGGEVEKAKSRSHCQGSQSKTTIYHLVFQSYPAAFCTMQMHGMVLDVTKTLIST